MLTVVRTFKLELCSVREGASESVHVNIFRDMDDEDMASLMDDIIATIVPKTTSNSSGNNVDSQVDIEEDEVLCLTVAETAPALDVLGLFAEKMEKFSYRTEVGRKAFML